MQECFRECFLHEIFDLIGRCGARNRADEAFDTALMTLDKFRIRALLACAGAANERFIFELPVRPICLFYERFLLLNGW